jgi:ferric-dicitrate binding protein FerR (iron transport regulator)
VTNGSSLISGYFDGTLNDAEVAELNAWILADPANAKLFAKHAIVHHHLNETLASERALRIEHAESAQDHRGSAGAVSAMEFEKASERTFDRLGGAFGKDEKARRLGRLRVKLWLAAAAALLLSGSVAFHYYEARPFVVINGDVDSVASSAPAFLTGDAGARWKGLDDTDERGLPTNQMMTLTEGYAEVTFSGGAIVVLQAPTTFSIESGTVMKLSSGKIAATVDGGGFVVDTPSAKVTDLGTEFGVNVGETGGTEVDVFKGKVAIEQVSSATAKGGLPEKHMLTAGDAAMVANDSFAMNVQGAAPDRFVRKFSAVTTSLDVVDLICGGNGTAHRRGVGIDVLTGESGELKQVGREVGDNHYHRVATIPVVDGCFVPDGKLGEMQVDSAGHTYQFPLTSNVSQGLLSAGGRPLDPFGDALVSTELGGTDYSEPGHGALFTYSNKGMTLDLAAIKRLDPTKNLYEFRCTVGNTFSKIIRTQHTAPRSDVYVLVDGQLRFERVGFTNKTGPFAINVPLKEGDRFLTLVTTDGGDTRKEDYVIWADPSLQIMVPTASNTSEKEWRGL